jgi:ABC-type amino acid transport substrate-binding protein
MEQSFYQPHVKENRSMKRTRIPAFLVMTAVFALVLSACGSPTPTATPRPAPTNTPAAATAEATAEVAVAPTTAATAEATSAATTEATAAATTEATVAATTEATAAATTEATSEATPALSGPAATAEATAEATEAALTEATAAATVEPTAEATAAATEAATTEATAEATAAATEAATVEPTAEATEAATVEPTVEATTVATEAATVEPTVEATVAATVEPTAEATTAVAEATTEPTAEATVEATAEATTPATAEPTAEATALATAEATAAATLGACKTSGELLVATDAAYPPFESVDTTTNEIVGFDIDLLNAIGASQGFTVNAQNAPFDTIFINLAAGQYDLVISAATITEARQQTVDFSEPYFIAGQVIIVRAADQATVSSPADLVGKKIGVQLGTTGAEAAKGIADAQVSEYPTFPEAAQALANGDVDAVVNDNATSLTYILNTPDANLVVVGAAFTTENYGIAVRKDCGDLLTKINAGLAEIIASGEYAEIYRKYFGEDPSAEFLPGSEGLSTPEATAAATTEATAEATAAATAEATAEATP